MLRLCVLREGGVEGVFLFSYAHFGEMYRVFFDAQSIKVAATATYSKTTYSSRNVANGYQATALYKGEVSKTSVSSIRYMVTYTGSKIPVLPGLDPDITVSQLALMTGAALLLLIALLVRHIRWHIVRVYVYNDERRIHDVVAANMCGCGRRRFASPRCRGMRKPSTP